MNERIKELTGKALDQAVPYTWTSLMPHELDNFTKKFAELIVKDVFVMLKEAMLDEDMLAVDKIINDRLNDVAGDVVDAYGIVDRIY